MNGLTTISRGLRHRNYRLLFMGQLVSFIGTWMTNVAISWLAYRLTGSAWLLGLLGFAVQLPTLAASPVAGVWVDRWDKRRFLIVTQTLLAAVSLSLAALTLTGRITVPLLLLLGGLQGIVSAFDLPCRHAFIATAVPKEDIGNAIALNAILFNVARLAGPAIGGIVIAFSNEGWCFLIDGVSFGTVLWALKAIAIPKAITAPRAAISAHRRFREGWAYAYHSVAIRRLLQFLALVSVMGASSTVLMPVFAKDVLGGGARTQGFLMAGLGCGALFAGIWLASRKSLSGLERAIPAAVATLAVGLIAFGASRTLWLSLPLSVINGGMLSFEWVSSNMLLQTIVEEDKRGRVMGFFMVAFQGMAPFGSLLMGGLAAKFGAPQAVAFGGACCLAGAGWFASELPEMTEAMAPIYASLRVPSRSGSGGSSAILEEVRAAENLDDAQGVRL